MARGGLPAGGAIAYALGTKAVGTLNVEFYTGVDQRLAAPESAAPAGPRRATGLHALVVDDVADTGETLALVRDLMAKHCAPGAHGGALRQVPIGDRPRLRVATDRPLDHVPLVGAARGGRRHPGGRRPSRPTRALGRRPRARSPPRSGRAARVVSAAALRDELVALADPERAAGAARYFQGRPRRVRRGGRVPRRAGARRAR